LRGRRDSNPRPPA